MRALRHHTLHLPTPGRGTFDITGEVAEVVAGALEAGLPQGAED